MTLNKFCTVAQGEYYNIKSPWKSQLFFKYFFISFCIFFIIITPLLHFNNILIFLLYAHNICHSIPIIWNTAPHPDLQRLIPVFYIYVVRHCNNREHSGIICANRALCYQPFPFRKPVAQYSTVFGEYDYFKSKSLWGLARDSGQWSISLNRRSNSHWDKYAVA